jgi:SnoaL-like domain
MKRFRELVEAGDVEGMTALLAEDVVFQSPIVFRPYEGRAAVGFLLGAVVRVFRDFRYTHELTSGATTTLVFHARVGDKDIEGVDLVELDADGHVAKLTVFVRPLTGAIALAEAMRAMIQGAPAAGAAGG